jgi:hypothetical protein
MRILNAFPLIPTPKNEMSPDVRGCAVNPDGSLKDAADIDFVYSESEDVPPLKTAASTSTLPPRSTRPDRLTQTIFNLANGNVRGGAASALVVAGARQPQKRKINLGKSASSQPKKSQKSTTSSDAATTSRQRAPKASAPSDNDGDAEDDQSGDDSDADEDEVTKYERLRNEGEHDRTVSPIMMYL